LSVGADGGTVRGAGGELQLSAAEAWAGSDRSHEVIGALQSGGVQAATSAGDVLDDAVAFADTQYELWAELGGAPLVVVMDTTTYHHAREALRGDLRAHNLLDLNLLAVAAVFFDYVLIQPDLIAPEPEEMEFTRIVRPAKGEAAQIEALHRVAVDDCARELGDLQDAWRTFLRDDRVTLDLRRAPYGPRDDRYYSFSGQDLPSNSARSRTT
jgi:hypothetical protein